MGVKHFADVVAHFRGSHKVLVPERVDRPIYVDAEGLMYWVMVEAPSQTANMSEHVALIKGLLHRFLKLTSAEVRMYYDGTSSDSKIRTSIVRRHKRGSKGTLCVSLPLLKLAVKGCVRELRAGGENISILNTWDEADPKLAADAREANAYVFTSDTDLLFQNVDVIFAQDFIDTVNSELCSFPADFVTKTFEVSPGHLPIVSLLCGNDYSCGSQTSEVELQFVLGKFFPGYTKKMKKRMYAMLDCCGSAVHPHSCASRLFVTLVAQFLRFIETTDGHLTDLSCHTKENAVESLFRVFYFAHNIDYFFEQNDPDGTDIQLISFDKEKELHSKAEQVLHAIAPYCAFYNAAEFSADKSSIPAAFLSAYKQGDLDGDLSDMFSGSSHEWWADPIFEIQSLPTVVSLEELYAIRLRLYGVRFGNGELVDEYRRLPGGYQKLPIEATLPAVPLVLFGRTLTLADFWGTDSTEALPEKDRLRAALHVIFGEVVEGMLEETCDSREWKVAVLIAVLVRAIPKGLLNYEMYSLIKALLAPERIGEGGRGHTEMVEFRLYPQVFAVVSQTLVTIIQVFDMANLHFSAHWEDILLESTGLTNACCEMLEACTVRGVGSEEAGYAALSAEFSPPSDPQLQRVAANVEKWTAVSLSSLQGNGADSTFFTCEDATAERVRRLRNKCTDLDEASFEDNEDYC